MDAIEGKVREMRKALSSKRAELRYGLDGLKKLEAKIHDMEMTRKDPMEVATARENLKKNRLKMMRLQRDIEQIQDDLAQALTPLPGQPGAPGILAHKRMLEIQDEAEERKNAFDEQDGGPGRGHRPEGAGDPGRGRLPGPGVVPARRGRL